MKRMKKSQGILEYTLLLGAIVAIVVVVLMGNNGIASKVKGTYNKAGSAVGTTSNNASFGVFNGATDTTATDTDSTGG